MITTSDAPEQPDLSRALGAAFDAAGPAAPRVLSVQPAALGGWMIHRDGSHGYPSLVDEAATCSHRRADTHRLLESGYLPNQGRHLPTRARHGAGAQSIIATGEPSDHIQMLMVQSGCTPSR